MFGILSNSFLTAVFGAGVSSSSNREEERDGGRSAVLRDREFPKLRAQI